MRDSQRARVYRAEQAWVRDIYGGHYPRAGLMTLDEISGFVADVKDKSWDRDWPWSIRIGDGRGRRTAGAQG